MIMKVLFFAINKGNRFGFVFDLRAINLMKACHSFMVLVTKVDGEDSPIMANVFTDVVAYGERHLDKIASTGSESLSPHEALEVLSNWFDKMSRNDPWLMDRLVSGYIK